MSYPTVARVVTLVVATSLAGLVGPDGGIQRPSPSVSWSQQVQQWLHGLLPKHGRHHKPPRPCRPPHGSGEEGPGTCPSGGGPPGNPGGGAGG